MINKRKSEKDNKDLKIHKKLIILAGIGLLLLVTITAYSLWDVTASFSHTTGFVERATLESRGIAEIEKRIFEMSLAVDNYIESGGDIRHRSSYETARTALHKALNELPGQAPGQGEMSIHALMIAHLRKIEQRADKIFSVRSPRANRALVYKLVTELDALYPQMSKDMERMQEEHAMQTAEAMDRVRDTKLRINLLFLMTLITSSSFLLFFAVYLYRKVSAPLAELWKGTGEISRGNLDYRIQVEGARDIELLADHFNDMARKLKQSYAELEQKLLDRTRELAALDAVALTLRESRTLKDLLHKALDQLFESLASLEPRGGIFLRDPEGELLRLAAQKGLPPDFSAREETIRMGECLCGVVAQTGEMLITEKGCEDPRHTLCKSADGHSHIIIPIKSRGIVLGVIFLYPAKNFTLKPSDIQMLDAVGAQLGLAVENFRFYVEVKASSEKFWDLFENARDILFTIDNAGNLTAVNKAMEALTGYSKVELVSKSVLDFLTPEGVQTAAKMLSGEQGFGRKVLEFEVVRRDGGHALLEVSFRKLREKPSSGGFQVSARDVTEQKALREMALRAERLGAIGEIVTTVRHEINNPLTTVIGNVELLLERYGEKDKNIQNRLEIILNNALRIAEIVTKLKGIKQDKVVEYLNGVKMTDLK